MKPKYFILFIFLFFSCNTRLSKNNYLLCPDNILHQRIELASLDDISGIKNLNGRFIRIKGYLSFEPENVALYPFKWSEPKAALWLNFSDNIVTDIEKIKGINYESVEVIGRVNINSKGHYSRYIAELDSVFCIKTVK